ncbi:MAG: hypothetical protein QCI82_12165, partial [Candidatus Thermoplasmatota archaeon]|nr:hypothetical protein [Candidatus Thermoplasmatota archaeon]
MEAKAKSTFSLLMTAMMLLTGLAVMAWLAIPDPGEVVDAAKTGPTPKSGGYMYVDNNDPEPKVEFEWIDAANNPKSYYFEDVWSYYSTNTHAMYKLPFAFPFFDNYYTELAVVCGGYIDFGGWQYSTPGYYYLASTSGVPTTSYENGWIAAWGYAIGGYYYYPRGDFGIYALQGETYGDRWVCFEWNKALAPGSYGSQPNPSGYEITFQIIIYESGLIKIQYLDSDSDYAPYSNGGYATAGIEDVTGTKGLAHCTYSDTSLKSGLAVMYGKNLGEVKDFTVDTDEGGSMYARHRNYNMRARVKHPIDNNMITVAEVTFGEGIARAVALGARDGSFYFSKVDPLGAIHVDTVNSRVYPMDGDLIIEFKVTPTFLYPSRNFQSIKFNLMGIGILPTGVRFPDVFWVETQLELVGALSAMSDKRGMIQNGGWVYGGEEFHFEGLRTLYPGTSLSPMPGTYSVSAVDERGTMWTQENVDGNIKVRVVAENDL